MSPTIPSSEYEENLATVAEGDDGPSGPAPLFVLRVVSGRDTGKSRILDWNVAPRVLVGQSRLCELVLTDPKVSRRHLSVAQDGRSVRVTDLGATNGTRVGGVRLVEALLDGGETLEVGDTAIRIVRAGELPELLPRSGDRFGRVLGRSQAMQRLFALVDRVCASALPVLIEGEAGTGKALLAEAIHDAGPRAGNRFVVYDASSSSSDDEMVALFGGTRPGAIEQAHGGTLVIEEVGDLSDAAQERLATVVESGQLMRSGAFAPMRLDVRIIATTRRDLEQQVQQGAFREDLLLRLTSARLEVPSLRQRRGDVTLLAQHFWMQFGAGKPPKALALQLERHSWPGNVRELEEEVARRVALGDALASVLPVSGEPHHRHQGDFLDRVLDLKLAMPHARQLVLEDFEQRYVERAFADHDGNVSRAAAASGVTRRYFHMLRAKRRTPR
jgi:two-component system, NtrC family, response regulator HydG